MGQNNSIFCEEQWIETKETSFDNCLILGMTSFAFTNGGYSFRQKFV